VSYAIYIQLTEQIAVLCEKISRMKIDRDECMEILLKHLVPVKTIVDSPIGRGAIVAYSMQDDGLYCSITELRQSDGGVPDRPKYLHKGNPAGIPIGRWCLSPAKEGDEFGAPVIDNLGPAPESDTVVDNDDNDFSETEIVDTIGDLPMGDDLTDTTDDPFACDEPPAPVIAKNPQQPEIMVTSSLANPDYKPEPVRQDWTPGSYLSFSQAQTWLKCSWAWRLRYLEKIKIPASAAMAFGSALHAGIEKGIIDLCQYRPIDIESCVEVAMESVANERQEINWGDEHGNAAARYLSTYDLRYARAKSMIESALTGLRETYRDPWGGLGIKIESEVNIMLPDSNGEEYRYNGKIDMYISQKNEIVDFKPTATKPDESIPCYQLAQVSGYTLLPTDREAPEKVGILSTYLTKGATKEPETKMLTAVVTDRDRERFVRDMGGVRAQIAHSLQTGDFFPMGRMQWGVCSNCDYKDVCKER